MDLGPDLPSPSVSSLALGEKATNGSDLRPFGKQCGGGVVAVAGGTDAHGVAELLAPRGAGTPRDLDPREAGWFLPLTPAG